MLARAGGGFGALALAGTMQTAGLSAEKVSPGPHFAPKAKRVIFLFMNGAPSHVDTFDPKPALQKHEGQKVFVISGIAKLKSIIFTMSNAAFCVLDVSDSSISSIV